MKRRLIEIVVLALGAIAFCSFFFMQDSSIVAYKDLLTPAMAVTYLVFGLPLLAVLVALLLCRDAKRRLFWAVALSAGLTVACLVWLAGASPSTDGWPLWRQMTSVAVLWAITTTGLVLPVEMARRLGSTLGFSQ